MANNQDTLPLTHDQASELYFNTLIESQEILEQCQALVYAILAVDIAWVKESLTFVLEERLAQLDFAFEILPININPQIIQ